MKRLSLSRAWDESRHIFAHDGGLLSAVALALLVLPQIVAGALAPATGSAPSVTAKLLMLAAALIGVIGQLAIVRLALGPSTSVGQAIAHGSRRFPPIFGALLILGIGLGVVLVPLMAVLMLLGVVSTPGVDGQMSASFGLLVLLLAVACVLIAVKFMMAVPVASAEEGGPIAVLKRSWTLSKGRYWPLLALELLLLVAAVVLLLAAETVGGSIARIVGGEISPLSLSALIMAGVVAIAQAAFTVLASVMLARIYVQLAGSGTAQASVPTSGT